jgi:hypothetical protein
MPVVIPSDELVFLERVECLGERGMSQTEIAEALGLPIPTLRSRVARRGLQLVPSTQLRTSLGGEKFSELRGRGEVVPEGAAR